MGGLQLARMEEALVWNMKVMTENKAKLEDLKQVIISISPWRLFLCWQAKQFWIKKARPLRHRREAAAKRKTSKQTSKLCLCALKMRRHQ